MPRAQFWRGGVLCLLYSCIEHLEGMVVRGRVARYCTAVKMCCSTVLCLATFDQGRLECIQGHGCAGKCRHMAAVYGCVLGVESVPRQCLF